ncbi:MAG: vWA domain-containing protein [Pseudomonadota bacterium]
MRVLYLSLVALALAWASPPEAVAQDGRPLLMPGTNSVFQRVLTRHGAPLQSQPGGQVLTALPAFQPLYVFARQDGWVQVGPTTREAKGWIAEDRTIVWKQNIVAAFTNSAGRLRSAMFKDADTLRAHMAHESVAAMQAQIVEKADNGDLSPDAGVITVERPEFVNIREQFYLMPILEFVEDWHPLTYENTLLMELASVPLDQGNAPPSAFSGADAADDFDAGVVFVLDTTQSMEPYIERTGQAIARIIGDIRGTDVGERVNFGVTGFRDNPAGNDRLEYRTQELIPLARRDDQTPVLSVLNPAPVARASTPGFNEDSLSGVEDAIDNTDWTGGGDPYDGKYVILVTDAGPKDPRDPNARSDIGPAELQRDAEDQGVVIMTLHLKTPAGGEANHAYAAGKYRALSRFQQSSFYYPIEGGSEEAFEETVTRLVTALTDHVRVARGEAAVLTEEETGEDLIALGLAMRLAYLGERQGTQAPDLNRGWASEKAVENPAKIAFQPRLLITKNELATMGSFIEKLIQLGEAMQGSDDADTFFSQLQSTISQMAVDPDVVINAEVETLGGALEYLEQLPYRSQIMDMTPDIWAQSGMQRRLVLDSLRQKLAQYRKWLQDGDIWTPLYDGAPDGEHVFAMPFDILP